MVRVAFKGADQLAGLDLEDFHKAVGAATGDHLRRRRKLEAEDGVAVGIDDLAGERAVLDVPEFHFARARRLAAAGGEGFAIGAESEGEHAINQGRIDITGADGALKFPLGIEIPRDGVLVGGA
jgi:hypothetical protein